MRIFIKLLKDSTIDGIPHKSFSYVRKPFGKTRFFKTKLNARNFMTKNGLVENEDYILNS